MDKKEQKKFLKELYDDYDPKYHDAFVIRYNKDMDKKQTKRYMEYRGIIEKC